MKYIKMNSGKDYLSLGNLVYIINKYSFNKESSIQQQVFCSLFDVNDVNNTTINNYLIGYRSIGFEYKKIYMELYNSNNYINIIKNILSILDEKIYINIDISDINNNKNFILVCDDLVKLSKEDSNIDIDYLNKINDSYNNKDYYNTFILCLNYSILINKQPIFNNEFNIDYSDKELQEYLKLNLYDGINYVNLLIELSKKDNKYANSELGLLEYNGLINGKKNYLKSYNYFISSAKKNHPKSCYMIASLMFYDLIKYDYDELWFYLNKAIKLGSIAAINLMGLCYLHGKTKNNNVNYKEAINCFKKASDMGYSYSMNNLGYYYEKNNNLSEAIKYYKLSADLNNSWALNKVGEYYRLNNDLTTAYYYYLKSSECARGECQYYSYYNLAKYYYLCGNSELNIKKDINLAKEYFNIAYENGIKIEEGII